jgi:hypothetical protein
MQYHFDVSSATPATTTGAQPAPPVCNDPAELMRQMLEVQRQQLAVQQALVAAHDQGARWRAFLARWREEFPELGEACRTVLPVLERTYAALIADLADHVRNHGSGALDNDFCLQEFLDRYGMRLAQLGTILNLVAPLAECSAQGEV